MALLTMVRHGQSTYNLENRFTGSIDAELTHLGEDEALFAGKKLVGQRYVIAYTSSLKRAQETLKIILREIKQDKIIVIKDKALDERMYGSLQGLNKTETIQKFGAEQVEIWRRSFDVRPPEGESLEDTYNRAVPYYKAQIEPHLKKEEDVLLVAHGNSLRALAMYIEKISREEIIKLNIPTGIPKNYVFDLNLSIISQNYL
jgi:2,3-bisphosphoglycerate-dependent phosphoglycerate mutase